MLCGLCRFRASWRESGKVWDLKHKPRLLTSSGKRFRFVDRAWCAEGLGFGGLCIRGIWDSDFGFRVSDVGTYREYEDTTDEVINPKEDEEKKHQPQPGQVPQGEPW